MIHEKFAEKYAASNRDMILQFYRNIGISAVAAALEATSRKPIPYGRPCDPSSTGKVSANPKPLRCLQADLA
jgi:hypothetical protein